MKKALLFCAAVAALVLSASCNKTGSDNKTDNKAVVLPAAQYTESAKKLLLNNSSILSIEFTESGRYIIRNQVAKADENVEFIRGTYTVNGSVYTLSNYGTVTVSGNQVTIEKTDGEKVEASYTEAPTYPANDFYTTIARAWKVDKTDISVSFDGKSSVGVVKNGCDIPAILKELEQKANVDINDENMAGYVVKEVNFTMAKTIEIAFTGKPSVAGTISLSENGEFGYELSGANGLQVFTGKANGIINLNPGLGANQIMMTLDAEVSSNNKTYNGKVNFILSPAA